MTREEAIRELKKFSGTTTLRLSANFWEALNTAIQVLEQEPCEDAISRKSIKQKLQEHHDFFVNAYGGFSNLPLNDKSRVDEITNCISMVVNEPSITSQPVLDKIRERIEIEKLGYPPSAGYYKAIMKCLQIIDKNKAESEG